MSPGKAGRWAGKPSARRYRQILATEVIRRSAGLDVLRAAMAQVERAPARGGL